MEILQLKYFLELAKAEHLTKVADKMYVSPSAISSSISRLENELGVKLFDRIGRNIKLNAYGKVFLEHAQKCLEEIEDGKLEIRDMMNSKDSSLIIAMTNPYVWNRIIHGFSLQNPEVSLNSFTFDVTSANSPKPGIDVDLVIASPQSFMDPLWDYQIIFEDRIAIAVPPQHHLYDKQSITFDELKDEWFVNLPNSSFSIYVESLCEKRGFIPKSHITCDYTVRPQIALNENLLLLSVFNNKPLSMFSGLKFIPISDDDAIRTQAIFWRKGRYLTQTAKQFIAFMLDFYKDYKPY